MTQFTLGSLYTGSLVRLGSIGPEDKDALALWSHDSDYLRNMYFDPAVPHPAAYYEEKEKDKENKDSRNVRFGIRTLDDGKLIGITGLWVAWNNQTAWFWIGIGEAAYRGKGYGTDAVRLMVGYAFRELGLYRVQLGVFSYNQRALRSYEKVGFVNEGAQRDELYRDGRRWDMINMSILRPEWEARIAAEQQATPPEPVVEANHT
jgi:RimJ/RimL family protein N-acetyltransferase